MIANIFILTNIIFSEQKAATKASNLIEIGDKKDTLSKETAVIESEKKLKTLKEKKSKQLVDEKLLEEEELFNDIMKKPLLKPEKKLTSLKKLDSKSHDLLKAENKNSDLLKTLSGSSHTPSISSLMTKKFSFEDLQSQVKELQNNLLNVMDMISSLKEVNAKEKSKGAEVKSKK